MIIYITLDDDGFVDGWGTTLSSDEAIKIEIDKNHDFFSSDQHAYKYVDEKLVKDAEKQQKLEQERLQEENKLSDEELNALAIMELGKLIMNGGE